MRTEQLDVSIKVLLRQVYVTHTGQIKSLEEEIADLKKKLSEAEKKLNCEIDCKRCTELEEAFNSCKTALDEQSKRFENLGQKFSVFNSSESKLLGNQSSKACKDGANNSPDESSRSKNITKRDLLKNLTSLTLGDCQDSLDLQTSPFYAEKIQYDYSTLNSDSIVLAPDTVDMVEELNYKENKCSSVSNLKVTDNDTLCNKQEAKMAVVEKEVKRTGKKRSSEESDSSSRKLNKRSNNYSDWTIVKDAAVDETAVKHVFHQKKKVPHQNSNESGKSSTENSDRNAEKKKAVPSLDIVICRDVTNKNTNVEASTSKTAKSNPADYQVSPSLLPIGKVLDKNKHTEGEDADDFQPPALGNKKASTDDGDSWTACDKKKIKKQQSVPKLLKGTSKFKLQLESLPSNYKKPNYKQTKLSQSVFKPKSEPKEAPSTSSLDSEGDKLVVPENCVVPKVSSTSADFDATCIPDNYVYEIVSPNCESNAEEPEQASRSVEWIEVEGESDDDSSLATPPVMPLSKMSALFGKNRTKKDDESDSKIVSTQLMNSFDRLPRKEEPNYKYKEGAVRKKNERKQLNAFDCKECEKYYSDLGLSDEEKRKRLKKCSRHRSKFAPPSTPEHFWELEFPDTQECKARGYMDVTQKAKLKTHRRRPLEL